MMLGRWVVRAWAAVSGAGFLLLMFTTKEVTPGDIYLAAGDGIAMAVMIFLMTVEAR